jgi:hypothetical protein
MVRVSLPEIRNCRLLGRSMTARSSVNAGTLIEFLRDAPAFPSSSNRPVADLPRCAVIKVAFHFLEQHNAPSSKEGV